MRNVVDANVVPSTFLRDVLRSFGIDADVVYNTADLRRFVYRVRDPLRPRLLCTRNFEPLYNIPCILRAFSRIQTQFPDATLTLVGSGSQNDALREQAAALRLRNVTFAGRVAPFEIHRYYDEADIYLQTPSIDNMPLSVLEAFASGMPVISTNVGGVPSILRNGIDGLLVPDNDEEALATAAIGLLNNPMLARRLAHSAHATLAAYQWSVVRDGWLRAYRGRSAVHDEEAAAHSASPAASNPA